MSLEQIEPEVEPTLIDESEYAEACELYMGWCMNCKEFTRECTEPDAEGYNCPAYKQCAVVGAEDALLRGFLDFREEP